MKTEDMIRELENVARKYDGKPVFTGEVNIPMMCREVAKRLEELSQPKADWIPCEERLPSEKGFYLVTVKRGCNLEVLCIWYQKECWLCDQEEIGKIIAWTFLPQPYKKEGAE
jgi:hypothetical protein